jgi:hypothetical protein
MSYRIAGIDVHKKMLAVPQLRSDNREAVDVSGAAAKGVASAQEFLDLGSNVGVLYYNELPMTAGFQVVVVRGAGS